MDPDVPVDTEIAEEDAGPSQVSSVEKDNTASSAQQDYTFGGRARKRKNPTPISQLIPSQPVAFQSFDGTDDYVENPEDASASASKRVRFV